MSEASPSPLRVLALEPYYGGSHRAVLDGLVSRLDIEAELLTLPPRKWKWRMRGAAITMAREVTRLAQEWRAEGHTSPRWDIIYASTFLNLAELKGLTTEHTAAIPSIVYFHENQLVYPNQHVAEWDFQFPLTNITSALAADRCLFNSRFTLESFLDSIPAFIGQFPDHRPAGLAEEIAACSDVLAPPFDPAPFDACEVHRGDVPRIIWPHRWEHDKNPEPFFDAVRTLAEEGMAFEVVVAGEEFVDRPPVFDRAREALGERLVHIGQPETREEYARLLRASDIAVSTATNEFFGLAMMEAAYAGCFPIVPDRLAYGELYPPECRYKDDGQLIAKLRSAVLDRPAPGSLRSLGEAFTFEALVGEYQETFESVARGGA